MLFRSDSQLCLLNDGRVTRVPDIPNHNPSAIDLTLVSPCLAVNCIWNTEEDCLGSDHFPISLSLDKWFTPDSMVIEDNIPTFVYKLANWELYQTVLDSYDLGTIENEDVSIFYSNFSKSLLSAAEHSIPKHKLQKNGKHSGNIWWTKECEEAVIYKKEQYKIWLKEKTEENLIRCKCAKQQCKKIIAKAKHQYWVGFCQKEVSESKDLQKVWKKVKKMKNVFNLPDYPIKIDNNSFPSASEKAEAFNSMFSENSLSAKLHPDIRHARLREEQTMLEEPPADTSHYLNSAIQMDEFVEALESFKNNNSAVGLDGISYQMLINLPTIWKELLLSFFQKCWRNGTIPTPWKQSVVVPIPKEGKPRSALGSYRPIALTSHVGKILEKIILQRLSYYCEKNNIIPSNQAGFRKGRSTTDHLVKLTQHIKKQFSRRKSTLATFFDVKKSI